MLDSQFGEAKQSKAAKNWLLAFESDIQTQAQMQLFHRCNFAYKHKQMYCAVTLWHTYSWLRVDVYVLLRLCEDRTGRDKGSSVGVFTANTAEENSLRRWRGSRLMATAKELELSCCEKSPQSQESEQETLSTPFKTTTTILGERKTL